MTVFVLLGPTAVGKTALSLQMAEMLGVPIINCDSRQIYREIPVCTAAPTAEEQARVQHFFVGTHGLDDAYSAAQYETDVMRLFASCPRDYLLSGGSMSSSTPPITLRSIGRTRSVSSMALRCV